MTGAMEAPGGTRVPLIGHDESENANVEHVVAESAPDVDEAAQEAEREKLRREREARAQALTLEIVGDLPYAEVKPPENVLFVCKLNPVTEDEDLHTIFSRFGPIVSCEVIRDKRTGDSLQYAFIEYENQKDCEQAYTKMSGVLIDDHRIHVDFSQSVSRLSDSWRNKTNTRRREQAGGFGGVAGLEKKRHYRKADPSDHERRGKDKYHMVLDKKDPPDTREPTSHINAKSSRSRSPDPYQHRRDRRIPQAELRERSRERSRDRGLRRDDVRTARDNPPTRSQHKEPRRGDIGRYGGREGRDQEEKNYNGRRSQDYSGHGPHERQQRR